jgi:hypothetical protein
MKLSQTVLILLTLFTTIHAFTIPDSLNAIADSAKQLTKRRGGGGRGGGGRSGGHTSSSSSRTSALTKPNSMKGGTTPAGSGPQPRSYRGGHTYYGGGAAVPYRAGAVSPGGVRPTFLAAGAIGFFPGVWLYGKENRCNRGTRHLLTMSIVLQAPMLTTILVITSTTTKRPARTRQARWNVFVNDSTNADVMRTIIPIM